MWDAIYGCCYNREDTRLVVLSRDDVVPYYLFEGVNSLLNLAIHLVVVLGRPPDLDTKRLHHLRPKVGGKGRVLVQDNAERRVMDIEHGAVELLEDFFRSGGVLKRDEICVEGKAVYYDYDGCVAIRLVKGASEVNS